MAKEIAITEIEGFRIGNAENADAGTGCTVILCENGAIGGVDVRGGSPGTRETDALNPICNRKSVHAVFFAGGSAFGLDAGGGVMRFLEEQGVGRDVGVARVPNVSGAILFDLKYKRADIRPDADMGYLACQNAYETAPQQGNFGTGTGCTVGKILGQEHAMKGGLGLFALQEGELKAGAVVAVNCVGDVIDRKTSEVLAGVRRDGSTCPGGSAELILRTYDAQEDFFSGNTVLACVMTNARLDKAQANRLAMVCHDALARAVYPAHTTFDGDTIFVLSNGSVSTNPDAAAVLACDALEQAILSGVRHARTQIAYHTQESFRS
ncbi:MAG TPA: P1 family peptidase [Clostridia bacterium]|nr:P1 family peptidase [Clostridia bacterium]